MENIIITHFSNPTSEGVILHLNNPTTLKSGTLAANEFWVSWDKIGKCLFDGYAPADQGGDKMEEG